MELYKKMDLNSLLIYNGMTLELIIWSMFAGICLAALIIMYNKNVLGPFIRALFDAGANSPETAKTLAELGYTSKPFVRLSLGKRGTFSRIVQHTALEASPLSPARLSDGENEGGDAAEAAVEPKKPPKKPGGRRSRLSLDEVRFFIPEAMTERADSIYLNGGASLLTVLITIGAFLIVALLLFKFIPALLQMIENFVEYIQLNAQ